MTVNLSQGPAKLRVRFSPPTAAARRTTTIELALADGTVLRGDSACAPGDNFSRFVGKKVALERLIYSAENGYRGGWTTTAHPDPHLRRSVPLPLADREDRARLWAAVLGPRYAPKHGRPVGALLALGYGWGV